MDSIHSRSAASKVEVSWHLWHCELVSSVLLDHLGFCNDETKRHVVKIMKRAGSPDHFKILKHATATAHSCIVGVGGTLAMCCPSLVGECPDVVEVFALFLVQDLRESLVPRRVLRLQIYNQDKK